MKFEKKVLVVGCGKSGLAATALLLENGAEVILYDAKETLEEEQIRADVKQLEDVVKQSEDTVKQEETSVKQSEDTSKGKLSVKLGAFEEGMTEEISLAVLSPGVPTDLPFVLSMKEKNIPIWGEIELAYRLGKGRVIGITGTNGKTTTTTLVGDMMKDYFESVVVVGNIGNPYTLEVSKLKEDSVVVAEISSFQLETIDEFKPVVSAVLNITPDHLNRHHTLDNYIKAKQDITKNQTKDDICVLNYDDEVTRNMAGEVAAKVVFFSRKEMLEDGICLDGEMIVLRQSGENVPILNRKELLIPGDHNVENAMAAIAIGLSMGIPKDSLVHTLRNFHAVEHRIEFVAEKKGVVYYNDSKGTNTDAAIKGIRAMDRKTVLIGGGFDKGSEYDEWFEAFDGKVKAMVLMGATSKKIAETAKKYGLSDITFAESMEEAVALCAKKAEPGEAVLLSPACASWGMFDNYEQRGKIFKDLVHALED